MTDELEPSLLTANGLIAWRGGAPAGVPEAVILTHQESLFRALAPRLRAKRIRGLFPQLRLLPGTNGRIALAGGIGIGGPATAMAVEELVASGARRIVMVDVAAGIDGVLHEANAIVAADALAADGTSRRYLSAGVETVAGSESLVGAILAALGAAEGQRGAGETRLRRVASTDAPFRETATLLESFRAKGAVAVDMETAAFYAAALALRIEAAAVLVIGDRLERDGGWRPPEHRDAIHAELLRVANIAKTVLLL